MADTPTVTVPVELAERIKSFLLQAREDRKNSGKTKQALEINTMLHGLITAPATPAPGGAVDDEAFKIATDLHKAYEQLIYGLPKYLDAENLTDEENMIREAWITLDVTAHRLAALATREEAPAEALRVAVEALETARDYVHDVTTGGLVSAGDVKAILQGQTINLDMANADLAAIDQALAALQAEQKGGA